MKFYILNLALISYNYYFLTSNFSNEFRLSFQILDEMPVFYNLNSVEKREVSIVILEIVRNLDDASLVKAWQQNVARTRLFFKLMEECLLLFEVTLRTVVFVIDWFIWFINFEDAEHLYLKVRGGEYYYLLG